MPKSRSRPPGRLRRQSSQGGRQDRRRRRRAAGVLQVSGRSSEDDESDRKHFGDRAVANEGHQGSRLAYDRNCHDLQGNRREQARWRAAHAPHLVALVRVGAVVHKGKLLERPIDLTPTGSCTGWTAIPPSEYGAIYQLQTQPQQRLHTHNEVDQTRSGSVKLG